MYICTSCGGSMKFVPTNGTSYWSSGYWICRHCGRVTPTVTASSSRKVKEE